MSYCVNCGVELADSEKICPLCQTEVINPRAPWKEPGVRPYPPLFDRIMRRIDRRYLAALISTFLLIPVAVTLITDWLTSGELSWSLYVLGAALLLEVWVMVPLAAKRYRRMTFLGLDGLAAILFLLSIERIGGGDWFLPLALPISATVSALILIAVFFFRRGRGRRVIFRAIIILMSIGVTAIVTECAVDMYMSGAVFLNWSLFVLSPCVILAAALLIINGKHDLKEEIRKRIFY